MTSRFFPITVLALCLTGPQVAVAKDTLPTAEAPITKPATAGQSAARERQQKCGAEWRALTDAQKASQGPKWPQYWSKCNKRLKGNDKA